MTHHRAAHASRPSRASEAGFALLEVIVSCAVLAIVAVAVLAGIDGAQSSTGREKARSVAANLAEHDQERMRSMQVDALADYTLEQNDVDVDGSKYKIVSEGRWVRDDTGGTVSCQNTSSAADYLQISSTVTNATVGVNTEPVVIKSLVAPSVAYSTTRGSLAVQVNDRNGVGVPNLAVNIAGPSADSAPTNDVGCAVFQFIPTGNYNITLNRSGWVDHFGNNVSVGNQDVTAGTLNVRTMDYDNAAILAPATVRTYKPGSTTNAAANEINPSSAFKLSANNSGEPGMLRVFAATPAGSAASTFSLASLFPFKSAYGVFTGGCAEANPVTHDSDYFDTFPGSKVTNPGATTAVTVRQPPLNFRVRAEDGSYPNNATVVMKSRPTTCGIFTMTTRDNPDAPLASRSGWPSNTATTAFDPGLPFGRYDVCIEYQVSTWSWRHYNPALGTAVYDNTIGTGRPSTLTLPPSVSDWDSGRAC